MRFGRSVLAATALSAALGSSPAAGAPSRTVAVLPLEVDGELGEDWRDQLAGRLLDGLARGEFAIHKPRETCSDADCFRRVSESSGARYLVRSVVVAEERTYRVRVEIIDGSSGRITAATSDVCDVCGVREVGDIVADQAAGLRAKLDDLVTGPPVVIFESVPPDALIQLDGETVGQAPVEREVTAGKHRARAEKKGYVSLEREFLAVAGVRETMKFELEAMPNTGRRWLPWGWASMGVGIATLGVGVTFLALDERPAPGDRCSGDNRDELGNCRFRYDTLAPGIALTVTGAVLATVGTAILIATRPKRQRRAQARALMRPGGLGLWARF